MKPIDLELVKRAIQDTLEPLREKYKADAIKAVRAEMKEEIAEANAALKEAREYLMSLKDGEDGAPGKDGEPGKDADPVDYDRLLKHVETLVETKLPDMIPDPVKGDPGEPGKPGEKGEPGKDGADAPAPTQLQVTEGVRAIYPDLRREMVKLLPHIEHKGTHVAGEEYEAGDEVIKGDSSYRAKVNTSETPPHEDWQCIAKSRIGRRGEPGEPGKPGEKGDPGKDGTDGVGYIELTYDEENNVMLLHKTNGEVDMVDVEKLVTKTMKESQ